MRAYVSATPVGNSLPRLSFSTVRRSIALLHNSTPWWPELSSTHMRGHISAATQHPIDSMPINKPLFTVELDSQPKVGPICLLPDNAEAEIVKLSSSLSPLSQANREGILLLLANMSSFSFSKGGRDTRSASGQGQQQQR